MLQLLDLMVVVPKFVELHLVIERLMLPSCLVIELKFGEHSVMLLMFIIELVLLPLIWHLLWEVVWPMKIINMGMQTYFCNHNNDEVTILDTVILESLFIFTENFTVCD